MLRSFSLLLCAAPVLFAADDYEFGPDSQRQPGVPRGEVTEFVWSTSKIFPGTTRKYRVYVPVQYRPDTPAPLMIFQDGSYIMGDESAERALIVLDNLIHQRAIPPMIAIFIDPGVIPAGVAGQVPQFNRSLEYDSLSDRYARFLIEEILPEVSRKYNISSDPNARGLAGHSSSAVCAFTAAWNRPDAFRRVVSWVGSFAALRGASHYPELIRKTEPKPLRIFMQDGRNDQNIYAGDWYLANATMASALGYAGYDVKFAIGEGTHSIRHGATILPEAMRWLWRDYPQPIKNHKPAGQRHFVTQIVDPDQSWQLVSRGHQFEGGLSIDENGAVYFRDGRKRKEFRVDADAKISESTAPKHKVPEYKQPGTSTLVSADHSRLLVSDSQSRWIRSFPIRSDGSLMQPQPYFRLETPDESSVTGANGMAMDDQGFLYVATIVGIQILDANGRLNAILDAPPGAQPSKIVFGGAGLQTLYVTAGDRLYRRTIRRRGVLPWVRAQLPTPVP